MQLNYLNYGTGYPLIILHGLFGSLDNWHTLSKKFAETYQVFSLDQRNHGRSPHTDEFNYQILAQDLYDFMQQQNLTNAYILGHSMGGKTAMQFAFTYPEKVRKLIVADIAPKSYPPGHLQLIETLCTIDLKSFSHRKEIDNSLAEKVPDFAVRQFILKNIYLNDEGIFSWKMNLNGIKKNYPELNKAITTDKPFSKETLFVRGEKSPYIQNSDLELINSLFTNAKLITIPKAGHWVHAEAPTEFYEILVNFLREN
jgi:pimeloyl-ACP methyl ester carboxylesterase